MSLLETLKAVKNEGFDPRTGKINVCGVCKVAISFRLSTLIVVR